MPIDASCAQRWTILSWATTFSTRKSSPSCPKAATGGKSSSSTSRMKFRKYLVNFCVLVVSVGVSLLLAEFAARIFLNPSDYLGVGMVHDDVLGATPDPTAKAGFDAWGLRNPKVPETADIVAVGDSHTFGNTATMEQSWPYVLAKLTGRSVYNM